MAVANHSNGLFIGKVGNTVSYMLKGKYVMRTIGKYTKKRSPKQLANQMSMKLTMRFLTSMKPFINIGYGLKALGTDKSAYNLATSQVKTEAIQGEYPNQGIDYSRVMLSKGTVPAPEGVRISKADQGIWFKWNSEQSGPYRRQEDSVMILLYFPETNSCLYTFHAAKRADGSCFFELPEIYLNARVEAYISFKQNDGKAVSDSVYAGNPNTEGNTVTDIISKKEQTQTDRRKEIKQRLNTIEATLKEKLLLYNGMPFKDKAYRNLIREYEALEDQLKNMPGKALS